MQIYLQTKGIKRVLVSCGVLLMASVLIIIAGNLQNLNKKRTSEVVAKNSKYLSIMKENTVQATDDEKNVSTEQHKKMNNEMSKNSIYTNNFAENHIETENSQQDAKSSKNENDGNFAEQEQLSASLKNKLSLSDGTINVYDCEKEKNVRMELEEYVVGCVCAEMPAAFESQALMAQAVAARTFAVRKMLYDNTDEHKSADVCTDYRHCQSFISKQDYIKKSEYADEQLEKITQSVKATKGIVALYDGIPINAVYHASSGHSTKSSKEVWGGEVPYLISVKAPEDKNICSKEYSFTYKELSQKLSVYSGEAVECFSNVEVTVYNDESGSAKEITISGESFSPYEIKKALNLRSDDFSVALEKEGAVFETYGYGHLVGMSQYGADELAKQGKSYLDILKYYYNGIEFGFLY